MAIDPVCGMEVNEEMAAGKSEYRGVTYYFCSPGCKRIDAQDKDAASWTATVDQMIANGAQLNAEERQAVIDYLVATH